MRVHCLNFPGLLISSVVPKEGLKTNKQANQKGIMDTQGAYFNGLISTQGHLKRAKQLKLFFRRNNSEWGEKGTYVYQTYQVLLLSLLRILNRSFYLLLTVIKQNSYRYRNYDSVFQKFGQDPCLWQSRSVLETARVGRSVSHLRNTQLCVRALGLGRRMDD